MEKLYSSRLVERKLSVLICSVIHHSSLPLWHVLNVLIKCCLSL